MPPPGIEPATPCILACHSNHSAIGERYRHVVRTFTLLFDQTVLQELCIVCKGYIENKNERILFTYSFVIDTISLQDDLYKIRFFNVFYVNNYI